MGALAGFGGRQDQAASSWAEAWVPVFRLGASQLLGPGLGPGYHPPPTSQLRCSHFPASPPDTGALIKGAMSILPL